MPDPLTVALISGGLSVGGRLLGGLFGGGGKKGQRGADNNRPGLPRSYMDTAYGKNLNQELQGIDQQLGQGFQRFSQLAGAATPTISDLLGASYARGGSGSVARLQQQASSRRNLATAFQGFNQFQDQLQGQRRGLLGQIGQYQSHLDQLGQRDYEYGRDFDYVARQNSFGQSSLNALLDAGTTVAGAYFSDRFYNRAQQGTGGPG